MKEGIAKTKFFRSIPEDETEGKLLDQYGAGRREGMRNKVPPGFHANGFRSADKMMDYILAPETITGNYIGGNSIHLRAKLDP